MKSFILNILYSLDFIIGDYRHYSYYLSNHNFPIVLFSFLVILYLNYVYFLTYYIYAIYKTDVSERVSSSSITKRVWRYGK